jgi:hypothetical protein
MGSLFILTIAGVAIAITKKKRIVNSTCYLTARYFYRLGTVKMRVIFFAMQVLSEFSLISTKTVMADSESGGGFPDPAATFARLLGIANFDLIEFVPMGCMLPDASSFYSKLVIKTVGPIVPVALLWTWPAFHVITGANKLRQEPSARFAAKYSLLLMELVLASVSTTVIETFSCSEFDGDYFLNAQLTRACDRSPKRVAWIVYGCISVAAYPIG